MVSFTDRLTRTRKLEGDVMKTELNRCLNTPDLCLIGIGSMIGSGMYVVMGEIAEKTGPAVVLSFLVAGIASGLSAWCYGEFGSRVPKAGSAYVYTYLTIGEFAAFVIGWNMILEHVIGAAAVCRGLVGYVNSLADGALDKLSEDTLNNKDVDPYAPIIVFIICCIVCVGVRHSVTVNNVLTVVNLSVALFVISAGFWLADYSYWTDGKFMPKGVGSVFAGAAQAYFAFVGYDSIAIASEEALTPAFSIPFALGFDVFFVGILYCAIAAALTLMIPTDQIDVNAAFASAFDYQNLAWAKYVVSVGAIAAMTCALLGTVFTMPRCIYALASDGLIFKQFSYVNKRTQVPVTATIAGGFFIAIFAFIFTLKELAEFMSIGTLLAYAIIAIAVIVLRYSPIDPITGEKKTENESASLVGNNLLAPRQVILISTAVVFIVLLNVLLAFKDEHYREVWFICILTVIVLAIFLCLLFLTVISSDNGSSLVCRVPFVPFLPAFSVFVNCYLMAQLNYYTWLRFAIWMVCGLLIYFCYGIWNSVLEKGEKDSHKLEEPQDSIYPKLK